LRIDQKTPGDTSLDYVQRVNRAIDFILQNLEQPLKLEVVARAACFSPFHFHRVFSSLLGETLSQFVKRLRLERALSILSHDPQRSLTDVALACGFGSSSDFSRSFRQRYGVPPSAFDIEVFRTQRREDWQAAITDPKERHLLEGLPPGKNPDGFEVELRSLPARSVAYIRVLDPYRPGLVSQAAARLVSWAETRGLTGGQWLGYMWDDPTIVAHKDCRYDVGLEVDDLRPEGEVGRFEFPPMLVAQLEIRGTIDLEMRALDWMYKTWLPSSGFVPTDQPGFEAWIGLPLEHGEEHFELHLQLPVEQG
jgi:AraC family transcriptional regulator